MVLPLGANIHDTLLLSLVPENRTILADDRPIWEVEPLPLASLKGGMARPAMGIADLYTWLSRSIKFHAEDSGEVLSELAFASGVECLPGAQIDPMFGYRIDPDHGRLSVKLRDRGVWRDFDSLLPDGSHVAPRVIEHATTLARSKHERFPRSIMVFGQANDKAKIEYWRMERFALPEALAGDRFVRSEIKRLLLDAEEGEKALWLACCTFARHLLGRGERKPRSQDVRGFVAQMSAAARYWSSLEARFHDVLRGYTRDCDPDDIRCQWLTSVRDAMKAAWEQHRVSVSSGNAWAIRALVKAEGSVFRAVGNLNSEIRKLERLEEDA